MAFNITNLDWDKVSKLYETVCNFSTKPNSNFRIVKSDYIFDENKSVKWNKEEAARVNKEYDDEVRRLKGFKESQLKELCDLIIEKISSELNIGVEKSKILMNFIYNKYHYSIHDMFINLEEYIDFIKKFMNS